MKRKREMISLQSADPTHSADHCKLVDCAACIQLMASPVNNQFMWWSADRSNPPSQLIPLHMRNTCVGSRGAGPAAGPLDPVPEPALPLLLRHWPAGAGHAQGLPQVRPVVNCVLGYTGCELTNKPMGVNQYRYVAAWPMNEHDFIWRLTQFI